ncbi:MAG: tetraacyldisaccharide 4'-kinase [candidate division Zixibacteria bacterium]|nr:tetraacyldisaccharide 4'-kinase [candidate division Zixibacteria bacterium]
MIERIWKKILRKRGLSIWVIPAFGLWLCSIIYRLAFCLRKVRTKQTVKVSLPVICVGNISVGGTGKTTIVQFLASFLLMEGVRVGIASSGYGRVSAIPFVEPGYRVQNMKIAETGDEVMLLAGLLPEVVFAVNRSKAEAAAQLSQTGQVDIIIVDDGFQHFRLARDIDIVTFDAAVDERFFKLFPYGVLREPLSSLARADIVVLTRSNLTRDLAGCRKTLEDVSPHAQHYSAQFLIAELQGYERRLPIKYLEDKSVFLFAGIGNFEPLRRQVASLCADLDYALELSDHQAYNTRVLKQIKTLADSNDSDIILTTGKDWVKLPDFAFGREIYYLTQAIDLDPGEEKLIQYLMNKLGLERRNI